MNPSVKALQTSASRYSDVNPFKGGAAYRPVQIIDGDLVAEWRCTTAFPWTHEGEPYMLSAGHCTTGKGFLDSWDPELTFADIAYDNWNNSKGSVKIAGKSYYSGDLVIGKVYENKYNVSARIYKGGPKGTQTRRVQNRWTTRSKVGQQFCTGGSTTGEVCGWKVTSGKLTVKYSDGTVLKNATRGKKNSGTCDYPGDSGGPVYTVLSNGHVYAKGVISGGLCSGWGIGSDGDDDGWNDDKDCSDATDYDCEILFTDIKLAEDALPGLVKKW